MHTTPPTLLVRLRESPDDETWARFVRLYTPLLFGWARRAGESEDDAADLTQDVFSVLVRSLPAFEVGNGQFRSWLRTVAMNKLRDRKRRQALANQRPLDGVPEPALPDHAEAYWESEYHKELARRALQLIQTDFAPETWRACWEFVANGRPAVEVARELGLTENAVYLARCRVLRRLRSELAGLLD